MKYAINPEIYPLEAVKLTAMAFSEKADIEIEKKDKKFEVEIKPISQNREKEKKFSENILRDFKKELLYNSIRYLVSQNNQKIREYIISQALFSSYPSEVEEFLSKTEEDYIEDPLKIAVPWEEKNKKRKKRKAKKKK